MWMQRFAVATALIPLLMLTLAVKTPATTGPTPVTAQRLVTAPPVVGSGMDGIFVGRWKADVEPGEGKAIKCETKQVGPHAWLATFNAVCDKDYAFTMEVPGRQEGDRVLFEATVDLGEQYGGEYHWTGELNGDDFTGEYTHAKYNGTFAMTRSADGIIDKGVYCEVPKSTEAGSEP